jgi:GMP synthase (glutamine-hydrolysing)
MTEPTRLVVLLTGDAPDPIKTELGDFTSWFRQHLGVDGHVEVDAIDITVMDEHDDVIDIDHYHGVVMSGSASMVAEDTSWMRYAVKTVQHVLEKEHPFLGVCFGHQILGLAVGADVGPNPRGREIGTVHVERRIDDDPLFGRLPPALHANVSHADVIREDLNNALEVVAHAAHDPYHAVRAGPWAWGVQYHPEFSDTVVRAYLEHRRETLDAERGHGTADGRLVEVKHTPHGHQTLHAFVEIVRLWSNR